MSAVFQSKPVKIAAGLVCLMLVLKLFNGDEFDVKDEFKIQEPVQGGLSNKQRLHDIEADSPKDTLMALTAHLRKTQRQFGKLKDSQNKASTDQNQLKNSVSNLEKLQKEVVDSLEKMTEKIDSLNSKMSEVKQEQVVSKKSSNKELDLTINNGNSRSGVDSGHLNVRSRLKPQYVTYNDIGRLRVKYQAISQSNEVLNVNQSGPLLAVSNQTNQIKQVKKSNNSQNIINASGSVPYFTIPENTTLVNATLFTGLLGRIPVNGVVDDPFPFTVLVGGENLAAMGFKIPGVRGMILRGTAKGDLTLSCVTGAMTSATFIFNDGTIKTHRGSISSPLAVIEDEQGLPCVPGKLISNAAKFISIRALLGGVEGAAQAGAFSETTNSFGAQTGISTSSVTGDTKKYMLNSMGARAAGESVKWWNDRNKQSFDVIFVRPGTKIGLSIQKEMRIDLDRAGRKVVHRQQRHKAQYKQTGLD